MAKYIDADRLRAEIENLIERYGSVKAKGVLQEGYKGGRLIGYEDVLNKLDSLQQEKPEVDLEKALNGLDNAYFDLDGIAVVGATYYLTVNDLKDIARDFYELGLRRAAEMYDEIEYNRQSAGEEPDKSLEEAAENIYKTPFGTRAEDFIAGAEWMESKILQGALRGKVEKVKFDKVLRVKLPGYTQLNAGDDVLVFVELEDRRNAIWEKNRI